MLHVLVIRFLLFIFIISFYSVESKLVLGGLNGNVSQISTNLEMIFELRLSINISTKNTNYIKSPKHFINVTRTGLKLWEICHLTFIREFEYVLVYAINVNPDFFKLELVYDKFGLVQLYTNVVKSKTSKAILIFVGVFDELRNIVNKKTTFWNQDSIFVIVLLECLMEVELEMESLWKYHKIYKYVLFCIKRKPVMYIYRPFVKDGEKRTFEVEDENEIVDNIVHAIDNLYGSDVRIVLFPQEFFALTDNGKYIGGGDYSPLEILQKKMNFHPLISPPTDGQKFTLVGQNFTGSMRDIVFGKADIAINGHFLKDYGTEEIVLSRFVYMDKLCFIVPMPSYNSPYIMIMQIFPKSIWILIALVYLTTIAVYHIFEILSSTELKKSSFQDLCLKTFAMFIFGSTSLKTYNTSSKLLLGGLLLNILIINNVFQGSLMTILSKPTRKRSIETVDQVVKSNLVLMSENVERLIDDPKLLQSLYRLQERKLGENVNFVRIQRFPVSHVQGYRNHLRYLSNNLTETLHIVSEYIKTDMVSFVFPKTSPLLDRINVFLLRFQESGLTGKWLGRDVSVSIHKKYKPLTDDEFETSQAKSFTLNDLTFIFTLLFIGLGISSAIFIFENILVNKQLQCYL